MKRIAFSVVLMTCMLDVGLTLATTAPKDGGPLPDAYFERLSTDISL